MHTVWTHACAACVPHVQHAEHRLQNEASAQQKKTDKSNVTFLTVTDIQACAQTRHLKPKQPFTPLFTHPEVLEGFGSWFLLD